MSTVWIVTSGVYSDFSIEGVFSTKAKADAHVASLVGYRDFPEADEWEVDDWEPEQTYWHITLWDDTLEPMAYASTRQEDRPDSPLNLFQRDTRSESQRRAGYRNALPDPDDDRPYWIGWVQAATMERAVKIAAEQVAMAKARDAGIA